MISIFKHKNYPFFWKEYIAKFKATQPKTIEETRFVVFDTETTGLDITKDRILSIGAVSMFNNVIDVGDSFEIYLKQNEFKAETVKIHGILKEGNGNKTVEKNAVEKFLNYIGNAVLVAHHAAFDITMLNAALSRMNLPRLKNKTIDTGVLYKKLENKKDSHFSLDILRPLQDKEVII